MLSHLEALAALAREGTMTRAATELRLTQSAVSKRIATLEEECGVALVEAAGRGVRLTPAAHRLLERALPLVAELREALQAEETTGTTELVVGVSESILASWGARLLAAVQQRHPGLVLRLNAHRSPVVLDRVRSGEYTLAICAGMADRHPDLRAELLLEEPLVVIPRGLAPLRFPRGGVLPVLSIEPRSATWSHLALRLPQRARRWPFEVVVTETVQSFAAVVALARQGFAHGLAPEGIARALGVPQRCRKALPRPGVTRPVTLIGRPSTLARPAVAQVCETLLTLARRQR